MKVIVGTEGIKESYQEDFPTRLQCVHCGLTAHIAFVVVDEYEDHTPVYKLYNDRKGENFKWADDFASFATYICSDCLKATTIWNQG